MKKIAKSSRRVGLIANPEKVFHRSAVQEAALLIRRHGGSAIAESVTAQFASLDLPTSPNAALMAKQTDLILVFGGDGTMLRVAREVAGNTTPILGINVGGLGFLTAVSSKQLPDAFHHLLTGDFKMEERSLIEATGEASGRKVAQNALNDIVISRGAASRMIELEVKVDGEALTRYRCDGLIVSSPTGSTAYSLSAGGAVVSPAADVFTLTPICPHTLSNRSVIVGLNCAVQVKVLSEKLETVLTADGQVQTQLTAGDILTIRRSQRSIRLLYLPGTSFFETLRKKLNWSGSNF